MTATPTRADLGADRWVEFPADWNTYTSLLDSRGERGRPRYLYLDGTMTVVSPGTRHEILKSRLGWMIADMLVGVGIDFCETGQVTMFDAAGRHTGAEADESYYLTHVERVARSRRLVMGVDPAPDLVVEVVVSHPETDALEAYRRFGVREVWVVRESGLEILVRDDAGRHAASPVSSLLPTVTADELDAWLFRQDPGGELPVRRQFRDWVEGTLVPRVRDAGEPA